MALGMSTLTKRLKLRRQRRERFAKVRAGPSNADPGFWLTDRIRDALTGNTLQRPYQQHPWVYRAVDVISSTIIQAPFWVVRGPEEEPQPVTSGPWVEFFRKPSPWLAASDFWTLTWLYQLLPPGDAFWILFSQIGVPISTPGEVPRWAYVVSGSRMQEVLDADHQILKAWKWSVGNRRVVLEPWQVTQFGKVNPENQWRRQSPLEAATRSVRTDHKAAVWNESLLDNGCDPGVILKMPDLHGEQGEIVRKQWKDRHGGPGKQGKVAVLTGQNDDVIRTTLTHTEMGFTDMRKLSMEEIASVYGVPLFVMGQLDDVRLETSAASMRLFWELTLLSWLRLGANTVNTQLMEPRGGGVQVSTLSSSEAAVRGRFAIEVVAALKRDAAERRIIALSDRNLGFSRDEVNARHELGFETDGKVGTVPLVRVGLIPLEQAEAGTLPPEPTDDMPDDSALAEVDVPEGDQNVEVLEDLVLNGAQITAALSIVLAVAGGELPRDSGLGQLQVLFNLTPEQAEQIMGSAGMSDVATTPNPKGDDGSPSPEEFGLPMGGAPPPPAPVADEEDEDERSRGELARAEAWHSYIREIHKPGEKRMQGKVKSVFNQIRARMLKFLKSKRAGPTKAQVERFLAQQLDKWEDLMVDQTETTRVATMKTSLDRLGSQIGGLTSASMESPAVQNVLLKRQQAIAGASKTVAQKLRFSLLKGISNEEGITGLEKRVKAIMTSAENHQAAAIARTETGAASTGARFAAYEEEGIKKHTWITAQDEFVRDSHQIDGQTRVVGKEFSNGLEFPLDPSGPAEEVINCRCDTIPEIER